MPTIAEIREGVDSVTSGEWTAELDEVSETWEVTKGNKAICRDVQFSTDADFFAHAPTDLAYLLGEVERLEKELKHSRESSEMFRKELEYKASERGKGL